MFRRFIAAMLLLVMLSGSKQLPQQVFNISKGSISIQSDAPLELIKAASTDLKGKLDAVKKLFAFTIKISSFKGFNSPLQKEHFNENYLESGKYPDAFFKGKIIEEVDFGKDGTYTIRAKGKLNIHGVEQDRIIKSIMTLKNGQITIKSNFTVQLADHNIPIPKVVHEKLASEINVEVNAVLTGE